MTIGYLRISTSDQTVENQRLAIYDTGYSPDKWYEVMAEANEVDTIVVSELFRLERFVGAISLLVNRLVKNKIKLPCIKEGIRLDGKMDITTKVMVTMFSLFAEIERDLIRTLLVVKPRLENINPKNTPSALPCNV